MEALKQEILKKKRELENKIALEPNKKYFKRGELLAKERQEILEKYGKVGDRAESERQHLACNDETEQKALTEHTILPRREVIRRLRDRGEPILLFGENEFESFHRLRRSEILEPEVNRGFRNDLQEALDKVDQAFLNEMAGEQKEAAFDVKVQDVQDFQQGDITYEDLKERSAGLGKGNREVDAHLIHQFFQLLLRLWGEQLNERPPSEKQSTRGKLASATFSQTQNYLKPLFRKLRNHSLPADILDSLTEILSHLFNRDYIKANDAYLEMAIGNAPWPIGVTMVGIHARTGREKIFSKNVAHVLNDETQRKYIQGLKRLMTRCQTFFPTAPSKCVEYQAFGPT